MIVPNEQNLLIKARAFDIDALGAIYDQFNQGIYRYALRLLGDENLAEDCVSDTFSRFLKILRFGEGPKNHLQAYLYRIAHNWITDSYRRNPIVSIELNDYIEIDDTKKPESLVDQNLEKQQIRLALRALTPDQRQVITLRFIENWPLEEIAEVMQKTTGAIKALQHRALEMLRGILTDKKVSLDGFER